MELIYLFSLFQRAEFYGQTFEFLKDKKFRITSRQNMQSLWLAAQREADSKCPRQKLFHIPQQEGLEPSSQKMDLKSSSEKAKQLLG